MKKIYRIISLTSAIHLGTYEADCEGEALNMCALDIARHRSPRDFPHIRYLLDYYAIAKRLPPENA